MKKKVKNQKYCIDQESRDITLIESSHKAQKLRQFIKILVKVLLIQLFLVIMGVFLPTAPLVVVRLTL